MRTNVECRTCRWKGRFGDLAKERVDGKTVCVCPNCFRTEVFTKEKAFTKIWTTQQKTARSIQYRNYVRLRRDRHMPKSNHVWVFTDGSSTGSSAAVILSPGEAPRELVRHLERPANANVGAEIMAVALGLKHVKDSADVMLVSDYLGTACWLNSCWRLKDPPSVVRLGVVHHLITSKRLMVTFIHHKGHQKDNSPFTRWNNRADKLCSVEARVKAIG